MKFVLDGSRIEFEIPDKWLAEAGVYQYQRITDAYTAEPEEEYRSCPMVLLAIADIAPPVRQSGIESFKRDRMIKVLRGLVAGDVIPAIAVHEPRLPSQYHYAVRDGFHRFYASAALGFSKITASVVPFFEL